MDKKLHLYSLTIQDRTKENFSANMKETKFNIVVKLIPKWKNEMAVLSKKVLREWLKHWANSVNYDITFSMEKLPP